MSDFTAISAMSASLKSILADGITNNPDPQLTGVPVHLLSPKEMRDSLDKKTGISLWLYRVARNGDLQNAPPRFVPPNQITRHALPLDMHYLVTPIMEKAEDEQTLLGRVAQLFNDHTVVRGASLQATLKNSGQEFRLNLETLTLEELTRVWHALAEPYQLSLSYLVQLVSIDSARELAQASPTMTRETSYTQIISVN